MDKRGKVFGKISIVDLAILLILLLAVGWFVYSRFVVNLKGQIEQRTVPCEITVLVAGVRSPTIEALRKSGAVFEFKTDAYLGTVSAVRDEAADVWFLLEDGRWVKSQSSDRRDVYVTIKAQARVGENVITINGVEIRVGQGIRLKSKWVAVEGNISEVEFPEGGGQ